MRWLLNWVLQPKLQELSGFILWLALVHMVALKFKENGDFVVVCFDKNPAALPSRPDQETRFHRNAENY